MMIAYASRTGTRRNLDALRRAGWRLMVSARGEPFDEPAFERAIARLGADADWIVVPDIVMGGMASLKSSRMWLARLRNRRFLAKARFMIAVQNGIMPAHVRDLVGPRVGVFVGGDTEWKLATMASWARFAHVHGATCHVGRVNSARRIRLCAAAGADSFDGSGVSRFAAALPPLDLARRQADVESWLSRDEIASLALRSSMPVRGGG
jgi:hypothetical protein